MKLVAVSGGESPGSRTTALVEPIVEAHGGVLIELSQLSAEGLLGRTDDRAVSAAVATASAADVLIVATPVYRAAYTGAVKAFFDRFGPAALANTAVVLVATAIVPEHFLSLDTAARALIASLDGWTVPKVVYATRADFVEAGPTEAILDELRGAVESAARLSRVLSRDS